MAVHKKEIKMKLPDILAPTVVQMLGALSAWLDKAEAQRPSGEAESLLVARLAPDMFPLATQIRFACVQAQEGIFRLRAQAFPSSVGALLEEGRNAAERPGSIEESHLRIAETIALVKAAAAEMPAIEPSAPIAHALPQGMIFDLTAEQYVRDWRLPRFLLSCRDGIRDLARPRHRLGQDRLRGPHVTVSTPGNCTVAVRTG